MSRPVMTAEQIQEAIRRYERELRQSITQHRRDRIARREDMAPFNEEQGQPRQRHHQETVNNIEDDIAELRRRIPAQVREYQRWLHENAHHPDNARADMEAQWRARPMMASPFHTHGLPGSAEYQQFQAQLPRGPTTTPVRGSPAPSVSSRMTAEQPPLVGYTYANDENRPVSPMSGMGKKGKGIGFSKSKKKAVITENPFREAPEEVEIELTRLPSTRVMRASVSEGKKPKIERATQFQDTTKSMAKSFRRLLPKTAKATLSTTGPKRATELSVVKGAINPMIMADDYLREVPVVVESSKEAKARQSSKRGLLEKAKAKVMSKRNVLSTVEEVEESPSPRRQASISESPKEQKPEAFALRKGKGKNKDAMRKQIIQMMVDKNIDVEDYDWINDVIGSIIEEGNERIIEVEKGRDWATSSRASKTAKKKEIIKEIVEKATREVEERMRGRGKHSYLAQSLGHRSVDRDNLKKLVDIINDAVKRKDNEAYHFYMKQLKGLQKNMELGKRDIAIKVDAGKESYVGKGAVVKMTKKAYMAEHKKLINLLNEMSAKAKAEVKEVKRGRGRPKKCVNNIDGGCGTCGGTKGSMKGGMDSRASSPLSEGYESELSTYPVPVPPKGYKKFYDNMVGEAEGEKSASFDKKYLPRFVMNRLKTESINTGENSEGLINVIKKVMEEKPKSFTEVVKILDRMFW
jgi:uncharacterized protein YpiB (UPF0302 family)